MAIQINKSTNNKINKIFPIAYLPSVAYLSAFLQADKVWIESQENYVKQTCRNRCVVPTANGILPLCIPIKKGVLHNCPIHQIEIDYGQPWQRTHWRAIETAYNTSPFFLYYRDYFECFYTKQNIATLFEYNIQLFDLLLKLFGIKKQYTLTSEYILTYSNETEDFRQAIHTKQQISNRITPPYRQVFSDRLGFMSNMSCIDLLFNEGRMAKNYLLKNKVENNS